MKYLRRISYFHSLTPEVKSFYSTVVEVYDISTGFHDRSSGVITDFDGLWEITHGEMVYKGSKYYTGTDSYYIIHVWEVDNTSR